MKSKFFLSLTILGLMLFANNTFAQLDSLYTQQWNRDPITDLNVTTSAQRQIINAEQIRVSGYTQLSQVFQLIDGWTINYTVSDNFSPQLQSNGTGSYNQQNWVLMLNGQRVELSRDEIINVDDLAVPVYDIERIEIVNSNGMYLGEFTQYGLINIITKKSKKDGIRVGALVSPLFSTDANGIAYDNTNIATSIGYHKNKFNINWALASGATSVPINTTATSARASIPSGRLEIQYEGKKITHQIQTKSILVSGDSNYNYRMMGYLGQWNINEHNQIKLSSSININRPYGSPIANLIGTLQHRYLKNHQNGNFIWQNGLGYQYVREISGNFSSLYIEPTIIIKPYSSINVPINPRINLFADAQVAFAHEKVAPKISIGIYKRVSIISNYSFVVAYNEMLLEESFLTTVNQDINAIGGAPYFHNPKLATADFYYNLNFGSSVKFSFNSGLKNSYDLPDYRYYLIPPSYVDKSIKRATYQLNWVNRINFHYDIVKNLVFDINYMNTRIVNTWDENLRNIPKHKFTFVLQYDLPKRFTLWSRNYVQSKTQWFNAPRYENMLNETELYYTLPPRFGWEIGLSKKLFKDYFYLNLTARNVFEKEVNYNPDQIHYYSRLSLSIIFNINGIGGSKAPKP